MPAYNMSRAHWVQDVEKLEAKGERVTRVIVDGASLLVVTELVPRAEGFETR